jgi:Tfp pilus assembly protein PilX
MKPMTTLRRQRGATLIVGLIMLVLITLVVSTAFMLSTTNLKSVGNMQYREEALAAANAAIEEVISSDAIFFRVAAGTAPAVQFVGVGDYAVDVNKPVCLYATPVATNSSNDANPNVHSEGSTGGAVSGIPGFLDTYWDIAATVNDGMSGTRVETHQGVKITLPENINPCS